MVSSKSWQFSLLACLGIAASALAASPDGTTDLHRAIYEDRTADARKLLADGADPAAKNRYSITPLALACANGNTQIVAALLDSGADPNEAGKGGATPLMMAARTGKPAPVKKLLEAGAKVNTRDPKGQTALMWAAAEGHADAAKLLLDAGAERDVALKSGFNAWFFAARNGHIEVIDLLLAGGADVNAAIGYQAGKKTGWEASGKGRAPKKGTSALLFAIENGHFELAAKLLEAGADANERRTGATPLHTLTWVRKPRTGDSIDSQPPPRGTGHLTSLTFVDALIKHGADVNARLGGGEALRKQLGKPGATPFLLAARTADVPLMKKLVARGADPAIPNEQGRTPLLAAAGVVASPERDDAANEDEAVLAVQYLLDDLDADIDVVDQEGDTVMHAAAYKQSPKLVRLLTERGADPELWNRKNKSGWTPVLIAEGFRYGNFKPSADTLAALHEVMRAAGLEPPPPTPRPDPSKAKKKYEDR